jgi:type II secretion system protein I
MTLLEVILALAILGGSMAVLGELVRVGTRSARAARIHSTAQLLADSLLAQITAGMAAVAPADGIVDEYGGFRWRYLVQVEQVDQQGLLAVAVTVREETDPTQPAVSYMLVRWMIDPEVELELESAAAQAAAASAGSSSASTSSSSSAQGSSGGAGTGGTP